MPQLGEFLNQPLDLDRTDGRKPDELRPVKITRNVNMYSEGSALIEVGNTRVLCTATVEEQVPYFLRNQGSGWLTAEYSMLPRSSDVRIPRESYTGRVKGRTHEIQRLIGRSLRAVVDLSSFGERQIIVDCDVLQADGGTRTAAITGAWVAMRDAFQWMRDEKLIRTNPVTDQVAAVSVGVVDGRELLDLCYEEDSSAAVDMNLVMTKRGKFVEIQGTAELEPFDDEQLSRLMALARKGIKELVAAQSAGKKSGEE